MVKVKARIALMLLYESRTLSTFSSVYNTAHMLYHHGYSVDLFLAENIEVDHPLKGIRVITMKLTSIKGYLRALIRKIRQYDLIIAYNSKELIISSILGKILRIPYIYFCLEIIGFDEIKTLKSKINKYIEIFLNKGANITIVHDEIRKDFISKLHGLNPNNILCVPNSDIGVVRKKTTYLRDKFEISEDKIIVLFTGGIELWAIDHNMINAVRNWDNSKVLVMHGWSRDNYVNQLIPLIDEINKIEKKIYLSLNTLKKDDYDQLIASADVALSWYKRELSLNVENVGLSSGKFSAYLRCGIPVIVPSYLKSLCDIVDKYNIGISADNEYTIDGAVTKIMDNYNVYRKNAFDFYLEHMDFGRKFDVVLHSIDDLTREK